MSKRKVGEVWKSEVTGEDAVIVEDGKALVIGGGLEALDAVADNLEPFADELILVVGVGITADDKVLVAAATDRNVFPDSRRKAIRKALQLALEQV